jgi:hypothetical protein
MATRVTALSEPHDGHSVGFNLGVIALVAALLGLGLAYLIDGAERTKQVPGVAADGVVSRALGGTTLTIPTAWLWGPVDQSTGFAKQVDLKLNLPLGPGGALRSVDVTLTQRSRVRPSASLLDGVYLHQFLADQLSGPVGLVGKPMAASEGYADETVWYDPISPQPFVAKCAAPIAEGKAGECLRTVYLGSGLAVVYSFPDDVLPNWKRFDAEMHPRLEQIGAL